MIFIMNTDLSYLKSLFLRCLNAEYIKTPESGNYCIQLDKDTLYILFQDSRGFEDWKNNLDFPAEPYHDLEIPWQCHRGFLKVWKAMQNEVEARVKSLLESYPSVSKIVCIGYSHGGAISVLATEDMEYLYGNKYEICGYGFGAPRVLWGIIPLSVRQRLKHFCTIRNIPDIVTHLPPSLLGFRNAGVMKRIGQQGKYSPLKAHYADAYLNELTPKPIAANLYKKSGL